MIAAGLAVIVVSGGVVSTVKLTVCWLVLPASSTPRTITLCGPSVSGPMLNGDEQVTKAPPSTLQVTVTGLSSVTMNVTSGVLSVIVDPPVGPVTETLGALVSIVNVTGMAGAPSFPAASVAIAVATRGPDARALETMLQLP